MLEHTKGDWIVRNYSDGEVAVASRPASGFIPVAHIVGRRDQKQANAHLIAAAPDLLEACKAMVENPCTTDSLDHGYNDCSTMKGIKAIAKATKQA